MAKKVIILVVLLVSAAVFQAFAQDQQGMVTISGDLTTIYTLGNASDSQMLPKSGAGAYYVTNPTEGARKNGFFTVSNIYIDFKPTPWLQTHFKLYTISRPGSFYQPLQMENLDAKNWEMSVDAVYGKVNIFGALDIDMPLDLYLKAGKYKPQTTNYGTVSKYGTESILYMLTIKNDFTYELGVDMESAFKLNAGIATNYRFDEASQRYYDEDGAVDHGYMVPGEYAPQFMAFVRMQDIEVPSGKASAELLYGNNVSNIYSGHAAGLTARYDIGISDGITIPVGLVGAYYEKNIDMLGNAAVVRSDRGDHTLDYRNFFGASLGTGLRYEADAFDVDFNVAGTFSSLEHYYRNSISITKLSVDTMITLQKRYFLGAGFIAGTLSDVQWKTREGVDSGKDDIDHTFTLANNMGYEAYAGINLAKNGKFVVGFNQNKGLSLNNMLEAKVEGQVKYMQEGTVWDKSNELVEAGGLYFKLFLKF